MTDLGDFFPFSINARGEVAGAKLAEADDDEDIRIDPVIYQPGKGLTLLPRPQWASIGIAFGISDNSKCAGIITNSDREPKAVLWDNGKLNTVSKLPSIAYDVNNKGQAVGVAARRRGIEAVLWEGNRERFLNDTISDAEGFLVSALDINERGQISGSGLQNGYQFGYILTPK
ncbi:MAG: hypothetical protein SFU56_15510 [Capsulimonadales bacterium]|nr:hypothetical protein [Capsulimonadales bacterium]